MSTRNTDINGPAIPESRTFVVANNVPTRNRIEELQRQRTTDPAPPDYFSSCPPPSYSSVTKSDTACPPTQARQHESQAQDHTGSCGVSASRVMAILGTSIPETGSGRKITKHSHIDYDGADRPWRHGSGRSGTWNVQGSPLSHFGSLSLKRWKKS